MSVSRKAAFCATFSKKVAKKHTIHSFLFHKKRTKRKSSLRESLALPGTPATRAAFKERLTTRHYQNNALRESKLI
jgi:hypothetical protein